MFLPPYCSLKKDPHRLKNVKENKVQSISVELPHAKLKQEIHSVAEQLFISYLFIRYLSTFKKRIHTSCTLKDPQCQ